MSPQPGLPIWHGVTHVKSVNGGLCCFVQHSRSCWQKAPFAESPHGSPSPTPPPAPLVVEVELVDPPEPPVPPPVPDVVEVELVVELDVVPPPLPEVVLVVEELDVPPPLPVVGLLPLAHAASASASEAQRYIDVA